VVDFDSLELLETEVAVCEVKMSYVPTLLPFKELPRIGSYTKNAGLPRGFSF
jgi:deoxyinosine 3'endonuclease (endonuclease V)